MPSSQPDRVDQDLSIHIFTASAGLVGVCLTVVGILRIIVSARSVKTFADDLLSLDALLFLGSCSLAYAAMRTRGRHRMHVVERMADIVFIVALAIMALACAAITYAVF